MSFSSTPTCSATTTARRAAFCARPEQEGKDLLLDIDVQGAAQIKRKIPEAVSIFVLPPNRQELEKRLRTRSLDAEACDPAPVGHGLSGD